MDDSPDEPVSWAAIVLWGCLGTLALALLFGAFESTKRCAQRGGAYVEGFWGWPVCVERTR